MLGKMAAPFKKFLLRVIPQTRTERPLGSVILLHGSGDSGLGIQAWFNSLVKGGEFSFPHLRVLYPTAPARPYTPNFGQYSNVWYDKAEISPHAPDDISIDEQATALGEIIKAEVDQGIPKDKIVIDAKSLPSMKRDKFDVKEKQPGSNEVFEGTSCTYMYGNGNEKTIGTEPIPDAIPRGKFKPVQLSGDPTLVTFDLETTGLIERGVMPQITQIAAVHLNSGTQFSTYITPTVPIRREVTDITGISMVDNVMKVNGTTVNSLPIRSAVDKMISWLSEYDNVCLVAHNGRRFDFPIWVSLLRELGGLDEISCGFIDSLSVFRELYPKQSLKQVDLVQSLLGESYEAHNAMGDVIALGNLLQFVNLPMSKLMEHSFTPMAVLNNIDFNKAKAANIKTLSPLIYNDVLKSHTAENIAGSGLELKHLALLHRHGGQESIRKVFAAKNSEGLPRVTNDRNVLKNTVAKLCRYFDKQ